MSLISKSEAVLNRRKAQYLKIMRILQFILLGLFSIQCTEKKDFFIPSQENKFVHIYQPQGDYFFGPTTEYLTEGTWYDEWVPNDHCFYKAKDGLWHIFGITHPLVESNPLNLGIHDGEYASFHAISNEKRFSKTVKSGHYKDLPKVLPPSQRPGEITANHAPHIITKDGKYLMIYGHSPIRMAVSDDMMNWKPTGELFSDKDGARDPQIIEHNGIYYISYCSHKSVRMVQSSDLKTFSEPQIILQCTHFDPESPFIAKYKNEFYLFVCSWDGVWDMKDIQGAYQHKVYVYHSDDLTNFGIGNEKEITTLNAHAPEIFEDENGQWYISSAEWPNRGVSVDKINWN